MDGRRRAKTASCRGGSLRFSSRLAPVKYDGQPGPLMLSTDRRAGCLKCESSASIRKPGGLLRKHRPLSNFADCMPIRFLVILRFHRNNRQMRCLEFLISAGPDPASSISIRAGLSASRAQYLRPQGRKSNRPRSTSVRLYLPSWTSHWCILNNRFPRLACWLHPTIELFVRIRQLIRRADPGALIMGRRHRLLILGREDLRTGESAAAPTSLGSPPGGARSPARLT